MSHIIISGIKINNPDITIIPDNIGREPSLGFILRTDDGVFYPLFRNGNKVPFGFGHLQGRVVLQEYNRHTDENGYDHYEYTFMLTGPAEIVL